MNASRLKIGIVAGERSGDMLGAGLLRELRLRSPDLQCTGLGGAAMQAEGFDSIADMQRLSVMGIIEPLKRLPDLFALRKQLREHFLAQQVDVVVTIDSPDFNLGLARQLKSRGLTTCHYVCPSVWAWRQGRVKKIDASIDHVLCLLPFEQAFLAKHGIAASFVGHPLADRLRAQRAESDSAKPLLCLMPGSRGSEVNALLQPFLQAALRCCQAMPELRLLLPAASSAILGRVLATLDQPEFEPLRERIDVRDCSAPGSSQLAMAESTVVLLASGTATLEAGLLAVPMVVAYKMSSLGYAIAKRMVKVEHVALPNLLLGQRLVPELVQAQAQPELMATQLLSLLTDASRRAQQCEGFAKLRSMLAKGADAQAAEAVLALAAQRE